MTMKLYVYGKSKNDINAKLANGEEVLGYNFSIFGGGGWYHLDYTLEVGTIIATYTKKGSDGYSPIARYWYTWNGTTLA